MKHSRWLMMTWAAKRETDHRSTGQPSPPAHSSYDYLGYFYARNRVRFVSVQATLKWKFWWPSHLDSQASIFPQPEP